MSKNRDDMVLIDDVLLYINKIEEILTRTPRDDILLMSAIRAIEVIGEAIHHLSDSVKSRDSSIPWREIVSMRNLLIHGYFEVEGAKVWETCADDIPILKASLIRIRKELEN